MKYLDQKILLWTNKLIETHHVPKLKDGVLDFFGKDDIGYNGPICINCGESWCWYDIDVNEIKHCENAQLELELNS